MPNSTAPPPSVFVPFPSKTNIPQQQAPPSLKPAPSALQRANGPSGNGRPSSVVNAPVDATNNIAIGVSASSSSSESSMESLESESPPTSPATTPIHESAVASGMTQPTTLGADGAGENFGDVQRRQLVNGQNNTSKGDHALNGHVHPNNHLPSGSVPSNGIAHLTPAFPMKAGCHRVNNGTHTNWEPCM